jgi:hypothetical protein
VCCHYCQAGTLRAVVILKRKVTRVCVVHFVGQVIRMLLTI